MNSNVYRDQFKKYENPPQILYIFRKPQLIYFSLERVFRQISFATQNVFSVAEYTLPLARVTPWNLLINCLAVRRQKASVYHITGDVHYAALALPGSRTILTIHDLAVMYEAKGFKRFLFKYLFLKWPVRHCRYITCISEKTKDDIVRFTGCNPERIIVIPNPVDDCFKYSTKSFNQSCPVILFVGTAPHKNLALAIEALHEIPCFLDVVGRIPESLKNRLNELQIDYRESFGLTNDELAKRYNACDIVLFPSLFEGFGLPIIEAQQSGRLLICSNRSPMQEVAGNGACLIDPEDSNSIRKGLKMILDNPDYRAYLLREARENIKRFDLFYLASRYEALYRTILE